MRYLIGFVVAALFMSFPVFAQDVPKENPPAPVVSADVAYASAVRCAHDAWQSARAKARSELRASLRKANEDCVAALHALHEDAKSAVGNAAVKDALRVICAKAEECVVLGAQVIRAAREAKCVAWQKYVTDLKVARDARNCALECARSNLKNSGK